jgi:predicted metal-dependent hydrolase
MPILQVGATAIPYRIRHSAAARRKRIVVTPDDVEVVVPAGQDDGEIAAFMHAKRRWVYDKREQMQERTVEHPFPTRFASGGKVLYRGRRLRLRVEVADVDAVEVEYRGGFLVRVPAELDERARDRVIGKALTVWMKARVEEDAAWFVKRHAPKLGVQPNGLRIKDQRHLWGSCGRDGVINLNWQLIFAPKSVLEYAVVHELCHLQHRDHSPAFWSKLRARLPGFATQKAWLAASPGLCLRAG